MLTRPHPRAMCMSSVLTLPVPWLLSMLCTVDGLQVRQLSILLLMRMFTISALFRESDHSRVCPCGQLSQPFPRLCQPHHPHPAQKITCQNSHTLHGATCQGFKCLEYINTIKMLSSNLHFFFRGFTLVVFRQCP